MIHEFNRKVCVGFELDKIQVNLLALYDMNKRASLSTFPRSLKAMLCTSVRRWKIRNPYKIKIQLTLSRYELYCLARQKICCALLKMGKNLLKIAFRKCFDLIMVFKGLLRILFRTKTIYSEPISCNANVFFYSWGWGNLSTFKYLSAKALWNCIQLMKKLALLDI